VVTSVGRFQTTVGSSQFLSVIGGTSLGGSLSLGSFACLGFCSVDCRFGSNVQVFGDSRSNEMLTGVAW
jgi:hypothetical protein